MAFESVFKQAFFPRTIIQFQRLGAGGDGHLPPGLSQGVDGFVIGGPGGEIGELKLEKDETEGVFQDAAVGIVGRIILEIEILHAANRVFGITKFAEDFTGLPRVKFFEHRAPLQIAGTGHWI